MTKIEKKFFISMFTIIIILFIIAYCNLFVYAININKSEKVADNRSEGKIEESLIIEDKKNEENENNEVKQEVLQEEENENTEQIEEQENNTENIEISNRTEKHQFENGETYDIIGTVEVPSLGIDYPIISEYTDDLLKVSVTKFWGGEPNKVGNLCIIGHNYKNSRFFGKLPNIEEGAIIKITDVTGTSLDYKVYETGIVYPEDTSCTSQLTDGNTEVTLITCYYVNGEPHASKRFYAKARVE